MKIDLVVAHYKEDLGWIRSMRGGIFRKIFVYSKGRPSQNMSDSSVSHMCLPNVGRESHTYITHCINNWKALEEGRMGDFTFFLQGSPHGMSGKNISEWAALVSSNGLDFTLNHRLSSPMDFLNNGRCQSWAGPTDPANLSVRDWCSKYIKPEPEMSRLPIFWNACFGVSTRCVLKSGWERLVTLAQEQLSTLNPECGHYCERLWYYIFSMESVPHPTLKDGAWYFWGGPSGSNHYGTLNLNEDGTVGLYENKNESFWRADGDKIVLMDDKKKHTCVLSRMSDDEYRGPFLNASNVLHRLTRRLESQK